MSAKFICIAIVTTGVLSTLGTSVIRAQEYEVDPAHTAVTFQVSHLGLSWTHGRFNSVSGKFFLDRNDPGRSSFALTISTDSIDTGNKKRDDHLRSPDFFNAKQFPVISFQSTRVSAAEKGYDVTGNLTLHGQRRVVSFRLGGGGTAEFPRGVQRTGFSTRLRIKRSDFGMTNMLEAVGDDVYIDISFEGIEKK